MMEMPTPCPNCGETVEFDDMNPCDGCRQCFCKACVEHPWGLCENCSEEDSNV